MLDGHNDHAVNSSVLHIWAYLALFFPILTTLFAEKHRNLRILEQMDCASEILSIKVLEILETLVSSEFSIAHYF